MIYWTTNEKFSGGKNTILWRSFSPKHRVKYFSRLNEWSKHYIGCPPSIMDKIDDIDRVSSKEAKLLFPKAFTTK